MVKKVYIVEETMDAIQDGKVVETAGSAIWHAFSQRTVAESEAKDFFDVFVDFYSRKYDRQPISKSKGEAYWQFGEEPTWVYGYEGGYIPPKNSKLRYRVYVKDVYLDSVIISS